MAGMKYHFIGLCGLAGVGKDTVGELLKAHAGFRPMAFANTLRGELVDAFHVESLVFTRREFKERPMPELALSRTLDKAFLGAALKHLSEAEPTVLASEQLVRPRSPRQIMQLWGTEYRREQDPDYWVRQVRDHIGFLMDERLERNFVVCDVRMDNEAELIRSMGGQIWQIKRPGIDSYTTAEGTHVSANDGSAFKPEVVINNTHDIRHLQQLVLGAYWANDAGLQRVEVQIA